MTPIRASGVPLALLYNDTAISGAALDEAQQDLIAVYCDLLALLLEQRTATETLRETEERFRGVVDNLAIGIAVISPDMRVLWVNPQMAKWFPAAAAGDRPVCFRTFNNPPRDEPCSYCPTIQTLRDGQVHEATTETPAGPETRHYRVVASPLRDKAGRVVAAIELVEDVTEQKRLEAQLQQANKMEAIGRLAGGVAHDFNNLLTGIGGFAQLALAALPDDSRARSDLGRVHGLVEKAAGLTRQLLAFSRQQPLQPAVINLNDLIEQLLKLLRRLIGEDIELVFLPASDLGTVEADPGQIEQVIMNLVVNARDAMPDGGSLAVETANVLLDDPYTARRAEVEPGPYVMFAVSDTGPGMDRATLARIFEPFFTTKGQGKGTGLGLATVYGIVKQHGGNITVYSEPGHGTTFRVYLPRTGLAVSEAEAEEDTSAPARGTGTILLVEDEAPVREVARRSLEGQGYDVIAAESAEEAEVLYAERGEEIDLLLTDVVMPGANGLELYRRLAASRPSLQVLYMSGYTEHAALTNGMRDVLASYIQKPFSPRALSRKVREVLGGQAAAGRQETGPRGKGC